MARLAFFTEQLPGERGGSTSDPEIITEFSYGLMLALADQQHDVRVFSTYREGESLPTAHARLQIVRPFRRWSWLEIPRLIPILLEFQPEILHFIQPRKEVFSGFTNAMSALPAMGPMIGRPRIVVSLYDVRKKELQRNRLLLSSADVVIVANTQQAEAVRSWYSQQTRQAQVEVVALPNAARTTGRTTDRDQDETDMIESLSVLDQLSARETLYIPGELDEHQDLTSLARVLSELLKSAPDTGVIFGGGWGTLTTEQRRVFMRHFEDQGVGARVILTGPLSEAGERACLQRATLVSVASLSTSSLQIARRIRLALAAQKPLILSQAQQNLDPLKWQQNQNVYIVPDSVDEWGETLSASLLDQDLRSEIQARLHDFARTEAVDEPGNAISRIYAQVMRNPGS